MEELLEALAARRRITGDVYEEADAVRQYRNRLVHGPDLKEEDERMPLDEACSRLCRYFSWMPEDWDAPDGE
jgi:hypothetical protein